MFFKPRSEFRGMGSGSLSPILYVVLLKLVRRAWPSLWPEGCCTLSIITGEGTTAGSLEACAVNTKHPDCYPKWGRWIRNWLMLNQVKPKCVYLLTLSRLPRVIVVHSCMLWLACTLHQASLIQRTT